MNRTPGNETRLIPAINRAATLSRRRRFARLFDTLSSFVRVAEAHRIEGNPSRMHVSLASDWLTQPQVTVDGKARESPMCMCLFIFVRAEKKESTIAPIGDETLERLRY